MAIVFRMTFHCIGFGAHTFLRYAIDRRRHCYAHETHEPKRNATGEKLGSIFSKPMRPCRRTLVCSHFNFFCISMDSVSRERLSEFRWWNWKFRINEVAITIQLNNLSLSQLCYGFAMNGIGIGGRQLAIVNYRRRTHRSISFIHCATHCTADSSRDHVSARRLRARSPRLLNRTSINLLLCLILSMITQLYSSLRRAADAFKRKVENYATCNDCAERTEFTSSTRLIQFATVSEASGAMDFHAKNVEVCDRNG